jgi:predicted O-methyltransferase YrrM
MKKFVKSHLDRFFASFARKQDLSDLYLQLAAWPSIKDIIGPRVMLGPLRGWALSPDVLLIVLQDVSMREGARVVEFGAGESTLAIAAALRAGGAGRLTTIEHDEVFAEGVRKKLRRNGLLDFVDMRTVPLRDYEARFGLPAFKSYDLESQDFAFDVALVDGPIVSRFGAATRAIPLLWCLDRLRRESAIYLDDAARPEEQAVTHALRQLRPDIDVEMIATEKGLVRMGLH